MKIHGYSTVIERGIRGGYAVRVPSLPDLRGWGATKDSAIAQAEAMLDEYERETGEFLDGLLDQLEASGPTQSVAQTLLALVASTVNGDRCRMRNYALEELPSINVIPDEGTASYTDNTSTDRVLKIAVRHLVSTRHQDADQLADQLYVTTSRALLTDPTLGDAVQMIREVSTKWEMESKELDQIALVSTYELEFSTQRRDPATAL